MPTARGSDENVRKAYDACLASADVPMCVRCKAISSTDRARRYYEICQQCESFCLSAQSYGSTVDALLMRSCIERAYIPLKLQQSLIYSTASKAQAATCLATGADAAGPACAKDNLACVIDQTEYQDCLTRSAQCYYGNIRYLATPDDKPVPFEWIACVHSCRPLANATAAWSTVYAQRRSCALFGNPDQQPGDVRLGFTYASVDACRDRYC